jgi:hypothetical protein
MKHIINGDMEEKMAKNMWSLLPLEAIELSVEAFTYGAKKYKPDNWREYTSNVFIDAMGRHMLKIYQGEECDEESGLSHLGHYLADCMMYVGLKMKEIEEEKNGKPDSKLQ